MDVTFRKINSATFRRFKARCAESGISMGEGFNHAASKWLGESRYAGKISKESSRDIHILTDLGSHIHDLHRNQNPSDGGKKRD
ncbi:MAG: hypothetical protein ABH863_03320 [Candidatus Micrarchaeota archaeon]